MLANFFSFTLDTIQDFFVRVLLKYNKIMNFKEIFSAESHWNLSDFFLERYKTKLHFSLVKTSTISTFCAFAQLETTLIFFSA